MIAASVTVLVLDLVAVLGSIVACIVGYRRVTRDDRRYRARLARGGDVSLKS